MTRAARPGEGGLRGAMKPRVPTRAGSGFLAAMAALAIFMAGTAQAQLSQPVVTDKAVDAGGNKFLQRKGQPAKTEAR